MSAAVGLTGIKGDWSFADLGRTMVTFWGVATSLGLVWWLLQPDGMFFALGAFASLLVSLPLARPYSSALSPWTLVAAFIYVSCGVRSVAVSAGIETTDRSVSHFILLQHEPGYFLAPALMYLAAVALMAAAFMWRPRSERVPERPRGSRVLGGPVVGLAIPLALIGAAAFVQYVRVTGGLNLANLSAKRTTINGLNLQEDYTSHGDLLFLNNLAAIAFWIVIAHYVSSGRRISLATREGWFTALLGLNAIVLPFYASSRSGAVTALLTGAGIALMLRPRQLPVKALIVSTSAILLLFSTMTNLRSAPSQDPGTALTSAAFSGLADAAVFNRNLADPTVAGHIYHAVPDKVPYQNGATITTYVLAPVPRSIWPEKPIINFGPVLGNVIYGLGRSGVPPGWVGDLYLNWGLPAVLAGSVLIGWILAQIDRWRLRQVVYTPAFAVLYLPLAVIFTKNVISKGIGAAIFNGGLQLAITGLCLLWISAFVTRAQRRNGDPHMPPAPMR